MSTVAELRAKIAAGEIKFGGSGEKGVKEGTFLCSVESAVLDRGNSGNIRGAVNCKVLSGGTDKDVGGKFNIYIATHPEEFLEKNVAEWTTHAAKWGIPEQKMYDDADTAVDVLGNTLQCIHKLALKGSLRVVVERKLSGKVDAKSGKPYYYNNVKELSTVKTETAPVPAPAAPVPAAPVPAAPAPAAVPAATASKKPWRQ